MLDNLEDLVTYDVAKLAKEKKYSYGSSWCYKYHKTDYVYDDDPDHRESYKKDTVYRSRFFTINNSFEDGSNENYELYEAPTQSQVQRFLREKHGIHILVHHYDKDINKYEFEVYRNFDELFESIKNKILLGDKKITYNSFDEALEEALFEGLKLIEV